MQADRKKLTNEINYKIRETEKQPLGRSTLRLGGEKGAHFSPFKARFSAPCILNYSQQLYVTKGQSCVVFSFISNLFQNDSYQKNKMYAT